MSPAGPPAITRLVLEGMSLFMISQSGGCCWLSVRRLGEISGLDKGTVSKHRTQAVAAGWLITEGNPRHRQCPKFFAAVPDGISIFQPTGAAWRALAARSGSVVGGNPPLVRAGLSFSDRSLSGRAAIFSVNRRSSNDETTQTQPLTGLQGASGFGCPQGREDAGAASGTL